MKAIPLENWAPVPEDPRRMQYVGSRTAQDVIFQANCEKVTSEVRKSVGKAGRRMG